MANTKTVEINPYDLKLIERAVGRVYDQIADDMSASDNEEAIEACIDADRLETFGRSPDVAGVIQRLCLEHGYRAVLTTLSRKIRLV